MGHLLFLYQERLSDLIGPYWGTDGIVYRVLQPLVSIESIALDLQVPLGWVWMVQIPSEEVLGRACFYRIPRSF